MVKSAEDRSSSDFAKPLNGTKKRYVLGECKMRPVSVVRTFGAERGVD
jgi:hypothetical protein